MATTSHGDLATALLRAIGEDRERVAAERCAKWERYSSPERSLLGERIPRVALWTALLDARIPTVAMEAQAGIPDAPGALWVLSGSVGVGKTAAAARWCLRRSGAWLDASALGSLTHHEWAERVERLTSAQCLVVDEVGGPGSTSPVARERVAVLVHRRAGDGRETLVTTNLDAAGLGALLDGVASSSARTLDRVRERGGWLSCEGESLRGKVEVDLTRPPASVAREYELVRTCDALRRIERSAATGRPYPEAIGSAMRIVDVDASELEELAARFLADRGRVLAMADGLLDEIVRDLAEAKRFPREGMK